MILHGDADAMIAGGAEAAVTPMSVGGFAAMRALSTRNDEPTHASRPFDKDRDGFVIGEGAGIVILEELGVRARARRKDPGRSDWLRHERRRLSHDGHRAGRRGRATQHESGAERRGHPARKKWATSTPTPLRRRPATATSRSRLKASSASTRSATRLKISGTKSMTGHLLGGAGGLEAGITVLALVNQLLPPTMNLENTDPECRLDYVPNKPIAHSFDIALSNSFGFGGINATLIMRRWNE